MTTVEQRYVVDLCFNYLATPFSISIPLHLYAVGKKGVTADSSFNIDNLDFITVGRLVDDVLADPGRPRSTNFSLALDASNVVYDVSNIPLTGVFGPSNNSFTIDPSAIKLSYSNVYNKNDLTNENLILRPLLPTKDFDNEFELYIEGTNGDISFGAIDENNIRYGVFYFESSDGIDSYTLDYTNLVSLGYPFVPQANSQLYQRALVQTIGSTNGFRDVVFNAPVPEQNRFSLFDNMKYSRSYLGLTSQKVFTSTDQYITMKKLKDSKQKKE